MDNTSTLPDYLQLVNLQQRIANDADIRLFQGARAPQIRYATLTDEDRSRKFVGIWIVELIRWLLENYTTIGGEEGFTLNFPKRWNLIGWAKIGLRVVTSLSAALR